MQVWTDGLVAVLDAVGSERASVFAMTESGLPVMLLAASHPQRIHSLVLSSPYANFLRAPDQSVRATRVGSSFGYIEAFGRDVGTGALVDVLAPSWTDDAAKRRWWARNERLAGGPGDWVRCVRPVRCAPTSAPCSTASRRRRWCCADAAIATYATAMRRTSSERIPDARLRRVRRRGQRVVRR